MAAKRDMDIEALLYWAYHDQLVDLIVKGAGMAARARGYGEACSFIHDYVDAGAIAAQEVHPDAEAVHGAVRALWPKDRKIAREAYGLVVHHARTGGRPDWMPGARPRLRWVDQGNGKPTVIRDRNGRPVYCPLEYLLTEENIAFARSRYAVWWYSLETLAGALARPGVLRDHRPTGFKAPFEPWSASGAGADGLGGRLQQAA